MSPPTKYGIIGYPLAHSASPAIYAAAFLALGMDATFDRIEDKDGERAFARARDEGYTGIAVTMPHKKIAAGLCGEISEDVDHTSAANTVVFGDPIRAYNTDVAGVRAALDSVEFDCRGKSATIFGLGGASPAVLHALILAGIEDVWVVTRSKTDGDVHVNGFGDHEILVRIRLRTEMSIREALAASTLVVNATPLGMKPGDSLPAPKKQLRRDMVVLDAVYRPARTRFLLEAMGRGATAIPGTRWFLGQAAEQFRLLTGREAPVEAMRETLATVPGCDWF
ncbi:MAG: shikimate dehydrogenase [Deltaproteobacteria bacterium]|nr:shikimate dehydrogenase [Deltaproteobacteria bacterium]